MLSTLSQNHTTDSDT